MNDIIKDLEWLADRIEDNAKKQGWKQQSAGKDICIRAINEINRLRTPPQNKTHKQIYFTIHN